MKERERNRDKHTQAHAFIGSRQTDEVMKEGEWSKDGVESPDHRTAMRIYKWVLI